MIDVKIQPGFTLKEVADSFVIVPTGANIVDFSAMITLNETGAFLFKSIGDFATEDELVSALVGEYEVDEATARLDVKEFVDILVSKKVLI